MIDTDKNKEQVEEGKLITITGIVTKLYFEELMDGRESFHDVEWDIQEYDEDAPKLLAEVKKLREELDRAYDTIQNYEEVIEPKFINKIERLERQLISGASQYNAVVDATGNAGSGRITVDVTFNDGEEYYGVLDRCDEI